MSGCESVLDVGCGADSPLGKIKKNFWSEGIDLFKKSIVESRKKKYHNKYKIADIRKIDKYYKKNSFDAVVALDLIEHLKEEEGLSLIKKMEKIARKKVIIFTPNGYYNQGLLEGNPYQIHKSGWTKDQLEILKYKVVGLRGLKFIRGEYATIKYRPWFFWGVISFITEPILYFFPKLSYQLFAVKKLNEKQI